MMKDIYVHLATRLKAKAVHPCIYLVDCLSFSLDVFFSELAGKMNADSQRHIFLFLIHF